MTRHTARALEVARGSTWDLDAYADARGWTGVDIVYGITRDSDALERSNMAAILALYSRGDDADAASDVARLGHWAVGWTEWITVDASSVDAARIADDVRARLADYPVLDDDAYAILEYADNHPDGDDVGDYCYADASAECHPTDDMSRILPRTRHPRWTAALEARYGTLAGCPMLGHARYHGALWHRVTGRTAPEYGALTLGL